MSVLEGGQVCVVGGGGGGGGGGGSGTLEVAGCTIHNYFPLERSADPAADCSYAQIIKHAQVSLSAR